MNAIEADLGVSKLKQDLEDGVRFLRSINQGFKDYEDQINAWREIVSENTVLKQRVAELEKRNQELEKLTEAGRVAEQQKEIEALEKLLAEKKAKLPK